MTKLQCPFPLAPKNSDNPEVSLLYGVICFVFCFSPKSPPNSPNTELSTDEDLKGVYINYCYKVSEGFLVEFSAKVGLTFYLFCTNEVNAWNAIYPIGFLVTLMYTL